MKFHFDIKSILQLLTIFVVFIVDIHCNTIPESAICKDHYCGAHSYKDILKNYRGLFHTDNEIQTLDTVYTWGSAHTDTAHNNYNNTRISSLDILDDNSLCCSTRIEHIANTTLVNVFGQSKYIVHLADDNPPNYQYIPHARCVRTGVCTGQCVLESKIVTLLALEAQGPIKFDLFTIPGYCTCKNVY